MFCKRLHRSQYGLGISIDSDHLYYVELKKTRDHFSLHNAGSFSLVKTPSRLNNKSKKAHITLPSKIFIKKKIQAHHELTESDFEILLNLDQSAYFPNLPEELQCDFITNAINEEKQEITIHAMQKKRLQTYLAITNSLHLSPLSITPDSYMLVDVVKNPQQKKSILCICEKNQLRLILFNSEEIIEELSFSIEEMSNNSELIQLSTQSPTQQHQIDKIYTLQKNQKHIIAKNFLEKVSITEINPFKEITEFPKHFCKDNTQFIAAYQLALWSLYEKT